MAGMNETFYVTLRKALAEISSAQYLGESYAEKALIQARAHINTALDDLRSRNHKKGSLKRGAQYEN